MNNLSRYMLATVMAAAILLSSAKAQAKNRCVPKVYVFGFSASFNDSVVFMTDIQELDSAWITQKSDFLVSRDIYSYQFRDYLTTERGEKNRTCIVSYALKRKKIDKKYLKMKQLYTSKGNFDVRYINENQFKFHAVTPPEDDNDGGELRGKAAKKAAKERAKQQRKDMQRPPRGKGGGPGMPPPNK